MRKRGGPAHDRPATFVERPSPSHAPGARPRPLAPRRVPANGPFVGIRLGGSRPRRHDVGGELRPRDRTREFASACERAAKTAAARGETQILAGEGPTDALLPGRRRLRRALRAGTNSEFAKMSSRIGHGIHGTSQKLERLAQLAKRGGMFDDPAQEIAELSAVIKQDITALNTAIAELQNRAAMRDASARGANARREARRSEARAPSTGHRRGHPQKKIGSVGATKSFKEVLTTRQERVKSQQDGARCSRAPPSRERPRFSAGPPDPAGTARGDPTRSRGQAAGRGDVPRLAAPVGGGGEGSGGVGGRGGFGGSIRFGGSTGGRLTPGGATDFSGQQSAQLLVANPQDQYLSARSEALQNVEQTITELGGIFQQLATMVAEQGEMAIRIDENVERSVADVDNAQTQMLKYLNSISSNRWLIMKIFGVLISFLVFFVVFIA